MCLHAQWRSTLCDPMDCSLPGSSVYEILQARVLERVAIPPPEGTEPESPAFPELAGEFFTTESPGKSLLLTVGG